MECNLTLNGAGQVFALQPCLGTQTSFFEAGFSSASAGCLPLLFLSDTHGVDSLEKRD